jgi:hypothetical protein
MRTARPAHDVPPEPFGPELAARLSAAGQLAMILFRTTRVPTMPAIELVGLPDLDPDLAMGPPGYAGLPALLTFPCYEAARDLGIRLVPGVIVTDVFGALLLLRYPRDQRGVMTIGMARLTQDFIRGMFSAMQDPPEVLLTLEEAAVLIRIAPDTLKHMVSDGRIRTSVKRGKPLVFVRDLLVQEWMAGR